MIKIGFFGTPEIASFSLTELSKNYEIAFVVTTCDKPRGRSQKVCGTPVKECAEGICVPVLEPQSLKDQDFIDEIRSYDADIFVVVAYGKIIPRIIFDMPRLGTINLHPSLLPKYRGAAPVQWALINGDDVTGVTVQMIEEKLDAGDIVLQEVIEIPIEMNAAELYEKVLPVGADLLVRAIEGLNEELILPIKQNENDSTYCSKIDRDLAHISWKDDSFKIHNLVRGLNPKPAAWTTFRESNLKIWKTSLIEDHCLPELEIGEITKFQKKRLLVGTGNGVLEIVELQPENKKRLDALSFLNGFRLQIGEKFE